MLSFSKFSDKIYVCFSFIYHVLNAPHIPSTFITILQSTKAITSDMNYPHKSVAISRT
jgi:hypothetical protein